MEELDLSGLSGASRDDLAMMDAWSQAEELRDHDVVDVNGRRLGRVSRCFAEEGTIPPVAIDEVDETIRLSEAGEPLVFPEDAVPSARRGAKGARGLPRKVR